jgi:hypothetical protein
MKKKLILASFLVVFGLIVLGTEKVLAATITTLPRLTTACETKIGGILLGVDDNFSTIKSCPGNSRKVTLGEASQNEGGNVPVGNVAFISNDLGNYGYVLLKNDETWFIYMHDSGDGNDRYITWEKDETRNLPDGLHASSIVQWTNYQFLTDKGVIYKYNDYLDSPKWEKLGDPVNNPNLKVVVKQ